MASEKQRASLPDSIIVSTMSSRVSSSVNNDKSGAAAPSSFFDRLLNNNSRRQTLSGNQPQQNDDEQDTAAAEDDKKAQSTSKSLKSSTKSNAAIRSMLADTYTAKNAPLRQHKSMPVDSTTPFQRRNTKGGAPKASIQYDSNIPFEEEVPSIDDSLGGNKKVEIAPVRSWNDFVLGSSSKFQLPDITNTTSSVKRAIINLLYYQTNYCVTMLTMFLLTGILNPREFTLGAITIGLCAAGYSRVSLQSIELRHLKQAHPMVSVGCIVAAAFIGAYIFGSVLVFLSGILLPVLLIIIHAAVRKPNLDKLSEELPILAKTPMASFLDMLGFNIKRYVDFVSAVAPR